MSQTERILYLDRMMRANGRVTVQQAAAEFEVCDRQIKRDIQYMRDRFDAPVEYSRAVHGYRYERAFKKLEFADQHFVLFYVILKSLIGNQQYIPVESKELFGSIEESIPQNYKDLCKNIEYQMPSVSLINPEQFMVIFDAVIYRKCLNIAYRNLKDEASERLIEPERVINYGGTWYMVCFDRKSNEIRTFHLARIDDIKLTDEKFLSHKEGYPNMKFKSYQDELNDRVSNAYGIFMGKNVQKVTVAFYGEGRRLIESQQWHAKQKLTVGKGEEPSLLTFPVASFTEVLGKILSFGALAKPVEPPELVELWRAEVKKMAEL
ncbi:MAG: WYL domain-containing protein [Treponema sp.]|nr:WYL domain-containing protein [Candidatus Treponema caballi]